MCVEIAQYQIKRNQIAKLLSSKSDKQQILLKRHHFGIVMVRIVERSKIKTAACLMLGCVICGAFMRSPVSSR